MARISDAPLPANAYDIMRNNLDEALVNNLAMATRYYAAAGSVLSDSTLPVRVQALAILRVTAMAGSDFEFSHHFRGSQTVGVTDEEARRVRDGLFDEFAPEEQAAIRLAQAVEEDAVTDSVLKNAAGHFPPEQLLGLVMAAVFYGFASRLTLAMGEAANPGFPTITEGIATTPLLP